MSTYPCQDLASFLSQPVKDCQEILHIRPAFVSLLRNFLMFHQQSQYKNVDCISMRGSWFVSFCGHLYKKINELSHTISNQILSLKCGFWQWSRYCQKYRPNWVSVSVSNLNQNNGFCHTLEQLQSTATARTARNMSCYNL